MRRLVLLLAAALFLASPVAAQVPPSRGIQVQNSSGNVAAAIATATLPALTNRVTYICGFTITSTGATAANTTIVVSVPSLGAGNTNDTVSAWGYQR